MKRWLILLCVFYAATGVTSAAERRIAFERDNAVFISNLDFTVVRQLGDGTMPAISPDATRIAFTRPEQNERTFATGISIVEAASGQVVRLNQLPGSDCLQPSWSPDGGQIAFVVMTNGAPRLGVVKSDGTGFKIIKPDAGGERGVHSPCWARDGTSIFCHDLTNLYRVKLDGSIIAQWKIGQIVPNGAMSSDGRIDVSPDGNRLLLSVDMDEEYTRKDWDGPVPALWSFDLMTHVAVRLTARNLFAWDACWLDDANILFVNQRAGENTAALFRTNGRNLKRLIGNARRPSVSKP